MNISGATIIRNGIKLGYPFVESIRSILPLCSEVVVGVGDSDDGTRKRIEDINDPKIRIMDSRWDTTQRTGGQILSEETNKVLSACSHEWIWYIQADEVAFEKDFERIRAALSRAGRKKEVDGLAFDYVHFYGSYFTVQTGRNWYRQEVRIVRNHRNIRSHGDAQGFRKEGNKINAISSGARMYHYGWARPPRAMAEKIKSFHAFWHDDDWIRDHCADRSVRDFFSDLGNLADFKGEHPAVMKEVINREFVPFIQQCRAEYLKRRSLKEALRDYARRFSFGQNRNFRLIGK